MSDVDDAIAEVWKVAMGEAPATPQFARRVEAAVTAEVKRLQGLNVGLMLNLRQAYETPGIDFALSVLDDEDET